MKEKTHYVLQTADLSTSPYAGYVSIYPQMPSGDIDNTKTGSLSMRTKGMRYFGE